MCRRQPLTILHREMLNQKDIKPNTFSNRYSRINKGHRLNAVGRWKRGKWEFQKPQVRTWPLPMRYWTQSIHHWQLTLLLGMHLLQMFKRHVHTCSLFVMLNVSIDLQCSVELQHPTLFPCPCHGGVATSRGRHSLSVAVRRSAQGSGEERRVLRASMWLLGWKSSMVKKNGRVCSFHLEWWSASQNMTYLYPKIISQWQMFSFKTRWTCTTDLKEEAFSHLVLCGIGGLDNLIPIKFLLLDSQEEIGGPKCQCFAYLAGSSRKQLLQDPHNISNLPVKSFVSIVWVVPNL